MDANWLYGKWKFIDMKGGVSSFLGVSSLSVGMHHHLQVCEPHLLSEGGGREAGGVREEAASTDSLLLPNLLMQRGKQRLSPGASHSLLTC